MDKEAWDRAEEKLRYHAERQAEMTILRAEEFGYDAGKNGSNLKNCAFWIFSRPEYTKAWELGKKRADAEKSRLAPQSGRD